MDKELEEAQKLTKDDLLHKLETGRPAKLGRRRALNQRGAAVVAQATRERPEPIILEVKREQMVGHFEVRPIGQPAPVSSMRN